MRQKYETSTGQTVHAILAYHRLTVMHGSQQVQFYIPQHLRGEARCTIRRTNWPRLASLLDAIEAYDEALATAA